MSQVDRVWNSNFQRLGVDANGVGKREPACGSGCAKKDHTDPGTGTPMD